MNTTVIPQHSPREAYSRVVGMRVCAPDLYLMGVVTTVEDSGPMPPSPKLVSLRWVSRKPDAVKVEAGPTEPFPDCSPYREPWSRRLDRWALLIMGWSGVVVIVGTWLWLVGSAFVAAFR